MFHSSCKCTPLLLLILLHVLPTWHSPAAASTETQKLEQEVVRLRGLIAKGPGNSLVHLELATTLHKLNHLKPDGGRRIPEAESAYRCVGTWTLYESH